jgi:hypothetical protein
MPTVIDLFEQNDSMDRQRDGDVKEWAGSPKPWCRRSSRAEHIARNENPSDFRTLPPITFCQARCQGRRLAVE